jgi:hypothetical protein
MGMVSGSPIAETVTTGTVTIPLMKKTGFPPHIAAAVEGAASTGAMIMPPVMGAGAFIMAEMTGIPYLDIIKVAAIPGILFYLSVGIMVYFESRKLGLRRIPKAELPRMGAVMRKGWYLFFPILVLMGALIIGYSPGISAVYGIFTAVVLSWFNSETRMGPRKMAAENLARAGRRRPGEPFRRGANRRGRNFDRRSGAHRNRHQVFVHPAAGGGEQPSPDLALDRRRDADSRPGAADHRDLSHGRGRRRPGVCRSRRAAAHGPPDHFVARARLQHHAAGGSRPVCRRRHRRRGSDEDRLGLFQVREGHLIYVMPVLFAYTHLLLTGTPGQNLLAVVSATLGVVIFSILSTAFFIVRMNMVEFVLLALATVLAFIPSPATMTAAAVIFAAVFFWQRKRAENMRAPLPRPAEIVPE